MNRLSARSWRLLAAIGFWLLLGVAFATGARLIGLLAWLRIRRMACCILAGRVAPAG